jgi:tetratricopeptide (TPR) repeat protein
MTLNWRSFKFFEPETIKSSALEELEITAATCGRNHVYLGNALGMVKVVERSSMNIQWDFPAYAAMVTHMRMPRSARTVLVTIGDDGDMDAGIIRVWDLEHRRGSGSNDIRPSREIRLFSSKYPSPIPKPLRFNFNTDLKITFRGGAQNAEGNEIGRAGSISSPVTCFDVTEDLQHIAVALTDNRVLIVRGELLHERAPMKIQPISSKHPAGDLTFIGFPKLKDQSAAGAPPTAGAFAALLYAVYEDVTVAFPIPPRNRDLTHVDDRPFEIPRRIGAKPECSALTEDGELVVASDTGVFYYGGDSFVAEKRVKWDGVFAALEAPVPAIEGEKCKLAIHKHYLVVLTRTDPAKKPDKFSIGIFDRESRIRAVSSATSMLTNPSWVLPDISDVLVICFDSKTDQTKNKMTKFLEITTQSKFDLLFKKDMYEEAKKIARQLASSAAAGGSKADAMSSYNIELKYGDHLYEKGKYDEAVAQYIEAIRTTEPSYVIRKFLGEQRISNLTSYLEALHRNEHGRLANKNHTTLLLNCYAKLKSEDKMNEFIRREDITFDAVNAIHVCRQAGSYDAATFLADKYKKPDEYVTIFLENLHKYDEALQFTSRQNINDAERILKAHAKTLLTHLTPDRVTPVLIRLCVNWNDVGGGRTQGSTGAGNATGRAVTAASTGPQHVRPEPFMPAFVDTPRALLQFLEAIVLNTFRRSTSAPLQPGAFDGSTAEVLGTLLELYLTPFLPERVRHRTDTAAADRQASPERPEPMPTTAPQDRLDKAFELLQAYPGQYDPYHALMLVQQHNFEKGVIFMLRSLNLHSEIFTYYAKQFESETNTVPQRAHAKAELLRTCEEGEKTNPGHDTTRDMWVSYLSLLVRSRDEVEEDITAVLERIERQDLLPPVAVIEILSASESLQLRAVRSYIINMINRDQEVIETCQREIDEMTEAARTLQDEVQTLQTTAKVFQTAKCNQCDLPLDTASAVVYFLCGHSYHESCVSERDCNTCGPQQRQHLQAQRDYDAAAARHEAFFDQLRDAPDGFSVIADHFGRGIFSSRKAKAAGDVTEFDVDDDDDDDLYDARPDTTTELEAW